MKVNTSAIVKCLVIGTFVYFLSGWLVFDFLLGPFTEQNTTHIAGFKKSGDAFSMPLLVLSCAAYSALITFIIVPLTNTRQVFKGLLIGVITGMLVAVMTDSYWYASSNFYNNASVVVADVLAAGVTVGVLSLVITMLWTRMSRNA